MSKQNPDEFVRRYQAAAPSLINCLTTPSDEMEAHLAPLWALPQRATLPRFSDEGRRRFKTSITEPKRARGLEYGALFQRREDLAREANVHGQIFPDLLNKNRVLDQLIQATGRVARAARDGRLLLNGAMAALNARVILRIEEELADPATPRSRRERLQSYLGAIYREEADQRGRDEASRRRVEARLGALRQQVEETRRSAQVRRFVDGLATGGAP